MLLLLLCQYLHQLEDFLIGQLTQYPEAYLKNHLLFFFNFIASCIYNSNQKKSRDFKSL